MKKKDILLIILLLISLKALSQFSSLEFQYYGSAKAEINGLTDIASFSLPSGTELVSCDIVVYHPKTYYSSGQNFQVVTNNNIYSSSSNFDYNTDSDAYGNIYTELSLNSNQTTDFVVQQTYNAETEVILTYGFTSNALFPTNISSEYTLATTNIQSNDPDISNKAASLTNECTTMQEAVQKIGQWVIGYLQYEPSGTIDNSDEDASNVFKRKTANCAGYTNLAIAMLRSVDIPARYISGAKLYHPYNLPVPGFTPSYFPMGGSFGPHAVYEVEYPDMGWVMSEPQRTLNFIPTHFVRHHHGADMCDKLVTITYSIRPGDVPPALFLGDMCGTITNFDNNYDFHGYSFYNSERSSKTVISVAPAKSTGIFDEVEIVYGPDEFKTGESITYQATFSSGDGTTYAVNWSWEILLYHSGGTYSYLSNYNAFNLWSTATEPLLPSYSWLIDPFGKISGEVFVTAYTSDGDYVSAKLPISVEECAGIHLLNQVYTTNTSQQGCFVTLENVSIQNNAKLTVNSEMGARIEKDFSMKAGTQLEIE